MARNIVGAPVEGEDCFGRETFLGQMEDAVPRGSVLLLAPRCWGKTSVLKTFRDSAPKTRHYFDFYDL